MKEIWKDIPGYETLYQVSNLGRVKGLDRYDKLNRFKKGVVLATRIKNSGYYIVNLWKDGKCKTPTIHQLVAITFLGHTPCGTKIICDHINGDKLDNCVDNIQLISTRENTTRYKTNGTSKYVGVSWDKVRNNWMAYITINKKYLYLGRFDNEYDAHLAYQNKLKAN